MPKEWYDIFPITFDINLIATGHVETVVLKERMQYIQQVNDETNDKTNAKNTFDLSFVVEV